MTSLGSSWLITSDASEASRVPAPPTGTRNTSTSVISNAVLSTSRRSRRNVSEQTSHFNGARSRLAVRRHAFPPPALELGVAAHRRGRARATFASRGIQLLTEHDPDIFFSIAGQT